MRLVDSYKERGEWSGFPHFPSLLHSSSPLLLSTLASPLTSLLHPTPHLTLTISPCSCSQFNQFEAVFEEYTLPSHFSVRILLESIYPLLTPTLQVPFYLFDEQHHKGELAFAFVFILYTDPSPSQLFSLMWSFARPAAYDFASTRGPLTCLTTAASTSLSAAFSIREFVYFSIDLTCSRLIPSSSSCRTGEGSV